MPVGSLWLCSTHRSLPCVASQEAVAVNSSLTTLGRCIKRLSEKARGACVPFRESTLTMLMKESLGGNCRTAMVRWRCAHRKRCTGVLGLARLTLLGVQIVTVAQDPDHGHETLSSLRFGERCSSVKNRSTRNRVDAREAHAQLVERLAAAKARLAELAARGCAGGINKAENQCVQVGAAARCPPVCALS